MTDDKKYVNFIPLTPEAFQFATEQANRDGLKISQWIGRTIELEMLRFKQNFLESDPDAVKIQKSLWKLQDKKRIRQMVFEIAALAIENPDEEEYAELLVQSCELAGIPLDDVIKETSKPTAVTSYVNYTKQNTLNSACTHWLSELLLEKGPLPYQEIVKLGDVQHFTISTIRKARLAINSNDPNFKIESIHNGPGWQWAIIQLRPDVVVSTESIAVAPQFADQ